MPWEECNPMDERLKFIARLLDGEKMAGLYKPAQLPVCRLAIASFAIGGVSLAGYDIWWS
jgi:hypothetical protein